MSDMITAEAAGKLLDDWENPETGYGRDERDAVAPDLARTVIALRTRLAAAEAQVEALSAAFARTALSDRGKMVKPEPGAPAGGYPGSLEQMGYPAAPTPAEHIVAAAVQIEGVTISLPRPARHGTILACISYSLNISPGQELQGFLTSTGRFVNRIQARHIADIAGQQPGRSGGRDNPELYSEDLW